MSETTLGRLRRARPIPPVFKRRVRLSIAEQVALPTVYGRYHYAADAVAAALVGVAAYNGLDLLKKEK